MITDAPIRATLASSDLERSRRWYEARLGWTPDPEAEGILLFHTGDSDLSVYESPEAGTAKNTVAMRNVPNLAAEMARLRGRGVVFEDYDLAEFRTVDGVFTGADGRERLCWFKDPDGNILSLAEVADDPMPLAWSPMLAASDLDRARDWYRDRLGFEPAFTEGTLTYRTGDTTFLVYPTPAAGSARNTVALWQVPDLRDEVARLRSRGVTFEDYDLGADGRTIDGILEAPEELLAWFKDSEGNVLGIGELIGRRGSAV